MWMIQTSMVTQNAISNTLTSHKVSEVVFQAKPRTKSFRCTGSALATPLISSAIEGYWEPLYASTCKQTHMHRVNHTAYNWKQTRHCPLPDATCWCTETSQHTRVDKKFHTLKYSNFKHRLSYTKTKSSRKKAHY